MAEKNMRLRVVLDLVDKALAPLKGISQGSADTAATLKAARDQLKQLGETQKSVGTFRETRAGLTETEGKLKAAREQVRQLAQGFAQSGPPTKAMAATMATARGEANQLGAQFNAQQQKVQQLRDKLSAAGISTKNLAQHDQQLRATIAATTARIEKQTAALKLQSEMQRRVSNLKQARQANVADRGQARGELLDGVALAATLAAPIKMAVDFESSMADVAKVMDFGGDENGLAKLSKSAIDLSKNLPMAAKDIAQIMALGGQSGLSSEELLGAGNAVGFTEHAIKMGTAFGMAAEEAGSSMAKMKSAFGMSIPEVANLTDKINLLGNTGAANEKQILSILTRVGPLGAVAGVASGEIAALGSTLAGMGIAEEVAATGIQNLMLSLVAGEAATKGQSEAMKKLGLDSTAVAKSMQKDAAGTMLGVFEKLQGLKDYEQASVMTQMFGKESIKAIAPMLTQLDTLKENFTKVNDETRYAGAVNAEYAARAATTANQMQLAKNQAAAMGITLGNVMLPALNDTLKALMPWMSQLTGLAQAYPGVTKAIVMGVGALMLFKIAAIAGAYALTFVRGALLAGKAVLLAARMGWLLYTGAMVAGTSASRAAIVISKALTAAQWLFNAALSANPIGVVVLAIVALVAAGVLLYRNWGDIVAGGKLLWQDFTAWLGGLLTGLAGWISGIWASIAATASSMWASFVSGVRSVLNGGVGAWVSTLLNFSPLGILWMAITSALSALSLEVPGQFRSLGGFLVDGIIGGITGKLSALKDAVVGVASSAAGWFKEKLGIASPSKVFTQFGGWISEGAAVGIEAGQAGVRAAAVAMAAAAMAPAGASETTARPDQAMQVTEASVRLANAAQLVQAPEATARQATPAQTVQVPEASVRLANAAQLVQVPEAVARLANPAQTVRVPEASVRLANAVQQIQVPEAVARLANPAQTVQVPETAVRLANAAQLVPAPDAAMLPPTPARAAPRSQIAPAQRPQRALAPQANSYTITIHAPPGMDPGAIARAVAAELDKRERSAGARKRSAFYDTN